MIARMHGLRWVALCAALPFGAAVLLLSSSVVPPSVGAQDVFGPVIGRPDPRGPGALLPEATRRDVRDHVPGTEIVIEQRERGVAGGQGSRLVHRAEVDGSYVLVLACFGGGGCGGRVAWSIGDEEDPAPGLTMSGALETRALVGPEGQAALLDAWVRMQAEAFVMRLSGSPMGIGGGTRGGVLGGGVQLLVGVDLSYFEFGVGGGIATLSQRPEGVLQRETGTLALRIRFGLAHELHVTIDAALAFLGDEQAEGSIDGHVVLPIGMVEITARGLYGFSGVWLGELGVVIWPDGESRRGVGLSILTGGGALFYQPLCRFGLACLAITYAGPHLGVGIHVRP